MHNLQRYGGLDFYSLVLADSNPNQQEAMHQQALDHGKREFRNRHTTFVIPANDIQRKS